MGLGGQSWVRSLRHDRLGGCGKVQYELAFGLAQPYRSLRPGGGAFGQHRQVAGGDPAIPPHSHGWSASVPLARKARIMGVRSSGHSRARLVSPKAFMSARMSSGFSRTPWISPSSSSQRLQIGSRNLPGTARVPPLGISATGAFACSGSTRTVLMPFGLRR